MVELISQSVIPLDFAEINSIELVGTVRFECVEKKRGVPGVWSLTVIDGAFPNRA